jgi:hypothetical protein
MVIAGFLYNTSMASASFNPVHTPPLQPIAEKLTRSNFPVWKALVLSALRGAQLSKFLEGEVEAPAKILSTDDKKVKASNLSLPSTSPSSNRC